MIFTTLKLLVIRTGYKIAYIGWSCFKFIFIRKTFGAQVVVWNNEKMLLVKSSYRNNFSFPGGYLKKNEPSIFGALRELQEETGLQLQKEQLCFYQLFKESCQNTDVNNFIYEAFLDSDLQKNITVDGQEIIEANFFKMNEVSSLPLDSNVLQYLANKESYISNFR